MDAKIFSLQGKEVGRLSLDSALWDGPVKTGVLVQAIAMYRTNLRGGLASTKTRGDVSGGGKKPFKQKHTGRARAGSIRSPLWRHGGSVFGPRPRDMSYRLPQTIRRIALLESLKGKLRDSELVLLDQLEAATPKTKPFGALAKTFKINRASVIVLNEPNDATLKSLRNLAAFQLRQAANLNAYDVLNAHKVLITTSAFEHLEQRIRANAHQPSGGTGTTAAPQAALRPAPRAKAAAPAAKPKTGRSGTRGTHASGH